MLAIFVAVPLLVWVLLALPVPTVYWLSEKALAKQVAPKRVSVTQHSPNNATSEISGFRRVE